MWARAISPAQDMTASPSVPSRFLIKAVLPYLRTLHRTEAGSLLWVTVVCHHEEALSNIYTLRLLIRLCSLPMQHSLNEHVNSLLHLWDIPVGCQLHSHGQALMPGCACAPGSWEQPASTPHPPLGPPACCLAEEVPTVLFPGHL